VLDCDGSIWISKSSRQRYRPSYALRVSVTNTRPALIQWFDDLFPGTVTLEAKARRENWRKAARWQVANHKAKVLLESALPFMVVKREQCLLGLEFASTLGFTGRTPDSVVELRERIYEQMLALNKRGTR